MNTGGRCIMAPLDPSRKQLATQMSLDHSGQIGIRNFFEPLSHAVSRFFIAISFFMPRRCFQQLPSFKFTVPFCQDAALKPRDPSLYGSQKAVRSPYWRQGLGVLAV